MKFIFTVSLFIVFCILPLKIYGQMPETKETEDEILEKLASTNPTDADAAAEEILRRGASMLSKLLRKKGDKRLFYGTFGLNPQAMFIFTPTNDKKKNNLLLKQGKLVTLEVAALYLVNAIYFNNMNIAQTPYLVDYSLPSEKQKAGNMKYLVKKAWEAVENWALRLNSQSLSELQKLKISPFDNADVNFY